MNKEIIEKIKSTNSSNELKELANKNGYSITDEEAKKYFELFHTNGKVNEQELLSISGGKCEDPFKWCRGRCRYSSDDPHYLIVTHLTSKCSKFVKKPDHSSELTCFNCNNEKPKGLTCYCTARKFDDDPLN